MGKLLFFEEGMDVDEEFSHGADDGAFVVGPEKPLCRKGSLENALFLHPLLDCKEHKMNLPHPKPQV